MKPADNELTTGQDFALRWLCKNYGKYKEQVQKDRIQPDRIQPDELFQEIADAVDSWAGEKHAELSKRLRDAVLASVDGNRDFHTEVQISARKMLKHQKLVGVASVRLRGRNLSAIFEFPV